MASMGMVHAEKKVQAAKKEEGRRKNILLTIK